MSETETTKPSPSAGEQALGTVKGLVEEHPVAMLAGGILLGALVAGALSRPAKSASPEAPRRSFGRRAIELAAKGAELAAAYAAGAGTVAEEPGESAPEEAQPKAKRTGGLAGTALRTLGPVLARLGRKTPG